MKEETINKKAAEVRARIFYILQKLAELKNNTEY